MGHPSDLNCPYCEKRFNNRGWLPKHIKQHHENSFLLDQNMTILQEAGHDDSYLVAEFNNQENPFWDEEEQDSPPTIASSTPSPPSMVPLCQNANKYIIKRGNTLPASFLTALLPAPGFLDMLNESLQTPASPQHKALQLPFSPRLDALQPPTSRVETQLPSNPQMETLTLLPANDLSVSLLEPPLPPGRPHLDALQYSQLELLKQWAETDVSIAEASILPSSSPPCSASRPETSWRSPVLPLPAWGTTSSSCVAQSNHKLR